jgi:NitT/TauT family transport system ATP-binding protein
MQQRVEIARVLINKPRVLLMDEPFGALDALTRAQMQQHLLQTWAQIQTTVLFITHDIDEALFLGDRLLVMSPRPGRIVADLDLPFGRPRDRTLLTDPTFVALKARCLQLLGHGHAYDESSSERLSPLGRAAATSRKEAWA